MNEEKHISCISSYVDDNHKEWIWIRIYKMITNFPKKEQI